MLENEQNLLQRAIRYDSAAFARLYDHYVYYRVGTRAQAEDLSAQVFLKAWEGIGNYRWTDRPFAAWLYRIAHNLEVDHFRAQRIVVPLDEIAEMGLTRELVQQAITRLTDDQQQVVILRFLQGYSTAEVARLIDKDQGAVRALQHRALGALRQVLRKEKQSE